MEAEFISHSRQQLDVAAAIGSKSEVLADVHLLDREASHEHVTNKIFRHHPRYPMGKGNQKAGFDSGTSDQGEALFECRHKAWRIRRTEKLDWMGVKSHRQGAHTKGLGALDYVRQNGLMTAMYSIEITDTEDGTTRRFVVAKGIAKDFHPGASAHHRQAQSSRFTGHHNSNQTAYDVVLMGVRDFTALRLPVVG